MINNMRDYMARLSRAEGVLPTHEEMMRCPDSVFEFDDIEQNDMSVDELIKHLQSLTYGN